MTLPTDRRGFLFGLGATLFADPKLIVSKIPVIHGDGVRDDWEGLQALLDGKPVRLPTGDTFAPGDYPIISGGCYYIGKNLMLSRPAMVTKCVLIIPGEGFGVQISYPHVQPPPPPKWDDLIPISRPSPDQIDRSKWAITWCDFVNTGGARVDPAEKVRKHRDRLALAGVA